MKTIEIKLYKFDELPEDIQDKVVQNYSDINTAYEWWSFTCEDAKQIGIEITSFDLDRGNYCELDNIKDLTTVADLIIENHGENTDTYKLAETFLKERDEIIDSAERDENGDFVDEYQVDSGLDDLEDSFKKDLSECYLSMLKKEYEYLSSDDAIIETIRVNEYDFTADGKIY